MLKSEKWRDTNREWAAYGPYHRWRHLGSEEGNEFPEGEPKGFKEFIMYLKFLQVHYY